MDEKVNRLRESLTGDVLGPSDCEYERARVCFNLLIDRRPAAIARCVDADDVSTSLAFAQAYGLEIAVRGGGHNPAGHCAVDDGLVIDVSRMRHVEVDPDARIAISEGGATWLDFDAATQARGLVTPGRVVGSTGVTGLALGGGIGHLTAQYGFTCDNLIATELVIPTGEVVRASDAENPELLWGLRGGGGNFGVATRLEFRLHPLERVVGGRFEYAGDGVREAIRTFRDVDAGAGNELSCQAQLKVDENLTPALTVAPCYTGSDEDPEEHRALRSAPGLVSDGVRAQGFLDQRRHTGSSSPQEHACLTSEERSWRRATSRPTHSARSRTVSTVTADDRFTRMSGVNVGGDDRQRGVAGRSRERIRGARNSARHHPRTDRTVIERCGHRSSAAPAACCGPIFGPRYVTSGIGCSVH